MHPEGPEGPEGGASVPPASLQKEERPARTTRRHLGSRQHFGSTESTVLAHAHTHTFKRGTHVSHSHSTQQAFFFFKTLECRPGQGLALCPLPQFGANCAVNSIDCFSHET